MSGPEVITLGCRLNAAESEAMRALAGALLEQGFLHASDRARSALEIRSAAG